jgi:hypothetical protein
MIIWFIVVVSIITGMVLLTLLRKSKLSSIESFQNTSGQRASTMEDFVKSLGGGNAKTTLLDATMPFKKLEQNYYNDVVGKEIFKSELFPDFTRMVELVVTQPDAYLDNKANTMDVKNIVADNSNKFTNADIKWCKSAKMPAYLPPHLKGATVGCGWYYIPDPSLTSSGALGQVDGPIFPNGPKNDGVNGIPNYGSGQWIWNLAIAQQLEDIKNCKRIKSCIAIDAPSVNNICGFCESTGYAIPTNSDGSEKYPAPRTVGNITAPAANCDTPPVMNSGSCYVAPTPFVTPDGDDCGNYGYPSPDYSIRLYTQDECINNMGGKWYSNGECLIQGGGSYSARCSPLNGVKPKSPIPKICDPDSAGKLSTECLISLAKSIGLTPSGSIIQMLQTAAAPGQRDSVAIKLLKEQNVNVDPVLYKGGVITVGNAIAGYDSIYNLIKSGSNPNIQNAAMWLCIGTTNFDPCELDNNASGPFFPECVQQAWRIAGCQPAGKDYPSQAATLDQLNTLTWGQVNARFQEKYKAMTSMTDPERQDIAIQKCLGITPSRPPPPPPLFKSSGPLKDIGYPGGGIGLGGDQKTYTDIIFTFGPQEWLAPPDGAMRTFIDYVNANLKINPIIATVISNNGDKFSGKVVGPIYYPPFDGPWGGSFKIQKAGPVSPIGDYYVKQNGGRNTPEFAAWDTATSATLILNYIGSVPKTLPPPPPPLYQTNQVDLKDIGFPGDGIGLTGDQKTYTVIVYTAGPKQWKSPDNTMKGLIDEINRNIKTKPVTATVTTNNGLTFSGEVTEPMGPPFWTNPYGGSLVIRKAGPVKPIGDYYIKQNGGRNTPEFAAWDNATKATLTLSYS